MKEILPILIGEDGTPEGTTIYHLFEDRGEKGAGQYLATVYQKDVAEFFMAAANAHYDMLELLEQANEIMGGLEWVFDDQGTLNCNECFATIGHEEDCELNAWLTKAKAAIAQAKP